MKYEVYKNDSEKLNILIKQRPEERSNILRRLIEDELYDIIIKIKGWTDIEEIKKEFLTKIEKSELPLEKKYYFYLNSEEFERIDESKRSKRIIKCIVKLINEGNYNTIFDYLIYLVKNEKVQLLKALIRGIKLDEKFGDYKDKVKTIISDLWQQGNYGCLCVLLEKNKIGSGLSKAINLENEDIIINLIKKDEPDAVDLAYYLSIDSDLYKKEDAIKKAINLILEHSNNKAVKLKYNLKSYLEEMIELEDLCKNLKEIQSIDNLKESYKVFAEMVYCGAVVFLKKGVEGYSNFKKALRDNDNYLFDKEIGRYNSYIRYLDKSRCDSEIFSTNKISDYFNNIDELVDFYFASFLKYIMPIQSIAGYHCDGNYRSFTEYIDKGKYNLVGTLEYAGKKEDFLTYKFIPWECFCRNIIIEIPGDIVIDTEKVYIKPKIFYKRDNPGKDVISYEVISNDRENWYEVKRSKPESRVGTILNILEEPVNNDVDRRLSTYLEVISTISTHEKIEIAISILNIVKATPLEFDKVSSIVKKLTDNGLNFFQNPIPCKINKEKVKDFNNRKYTEFAGDIIESWLDYAKNGLNNEELQAITYIFFNTVISFLVPVYNLLSVYENAKIPLKRINELLLDEWIYGCCKNTNKNKKIYIVQKNMFGIDLKRQGNEIYENSQVVGKYVLYTIQANLCENRMSSIIKEVRICEKADKKVVVESALKAGNLGRALQLRKNDLYYFDEINEVDFIRMWIDRHLSDEKFNEKNRSQKIDEIFVLEKNSKGEIFIKGFEKGILKDYNDESSNLYSGRNVRITGMETEKESLIVVCCDS